MERPSTPPPTPTLALAALLERLRKERDRLAGLPGHTEKLGGLTALGQRVEGLLRATLEAQWAEHGGADAAFPKMTERSLRYDRASAGQVVYAILASADRGAPAGGVTGALVAELRAEDSVLCALVSLRNAAVHGREERPAAELIALFDGALARLGAVAAAR
ncbi:MAG: hypothetical protein U0324_20005 [Polyangiales bacterium]